MTVLTRRYVIFGSLLAAVAVIAGALGSHALRGVLSPKMMAAYQVAVQYHFYHALGLLAVAGVAAQVRDRRWVKWAGVAMLLGILLFSGSLYLLSLTGIRWLGAITPLGGLSFILAWVMLAVAAHKG